MALFTFQSTAAETFNGTSDSDLFVASNNFLGAGDRAFGMGGIDDFQYFADTSLTGGVAGVDVFGTVTAIKTFAAFVLNSVETFTSINDSAQTLVFDMSSSADITDVVVSNSTAAVVYDELAKPFLETFEQSDPFAQGAFEVELALHRALGDRGDAILEPGEIGELVDAFLPDHRRIHVRHEQVGNAEFVARDDRVGGVKEALDHARQNV